MTKKVLVLLTVVFIITVIGSVVYGYDTMQDGAQCFMYSKGYSYQAPLRVLNIYTDYTPVSGDLVTLYSWSESDLQLWKIVLNDDLNWVPSSSYRVESAANYSLALNYNQATTKCTMYPYASNDADDFPIGFESLNGGGHILWLYNRSNRYLWNSGNYLGAQCYWHTVDNSGVSSEDVWCLFP